MLKLTAAGDLSRSAGRLETLSESTNRNACIGQRIAVRLRRWRGEYSFDTRLGVDWQRLLQKGTSSALLRAEIAREVTRVPGVRSIRDIVISAPNASRAVTITGSVVVVGSDEVVTFSATVEA